MILVGLGANLPSAAGPPEATIAAALAALDEAGIAILARSRLYRTAPEPRSDQPWFVNAVAALETRRDPAALLALFHRVEARFGRRRAQPDEPRPLDLDLLAYDGLVRTGPEGPILPHPRLHQRAFVLLPLREVAPDWRHPRLGRSVNEMIAALPPGQTAEALGG
jgi:2-amino-4-hydroxy-6-hydroxymethyldihydropteridine diphosphokinase